MNISKETVDYLKERFTVVSFLNDNSDNTTQEKATKLGLFFPIDEGYTTMVLKAPKKEMTIEWIEGNFTKDKVYKSFAPFFKKYLAKTGVGNFDVFATTYGIGVMAILNRNKAQDIAQISEQLDKLGIKYYTEWSDAQWVYRFKISKEISNIEKIKKIL